MSNIFLKDNFYVQWHILDRCNLRCLHCYQDQFSREREPGWPQLQKAADNVLNTMAAWNAKLDVALTGGEPFLKTELFQLLKYLDTSKNVGGMSIISNGTLWPNYAHQLKEISKFQGIRISLDGISSKTNDEIRGPGVFNKVIENITRWQNLGIPVTIMFTVMKRNLPEIPYLIEFGKKLGIDSLVIERFFPIGQGEANKADMIDGLEFLGIWQTILAREGIAVEPGELISYRAIKINFDETGTDILGSGCVVSDDGAAILPDGTVLPCRRFPLPIGNITNTPLAGIWYHSPVLDLLKNKTHLQGKCGKCQVEECCGCRAMCYCLTGNFLAEDPHCWVV
ncbi:MAG: radical SAM protein [Acidobacteria bacterium]|jgi:MoaA/NifB/PqqE/SkfB family radical SAM enzyme|nr:radical SAM protein [Acidobacteriota bacterium]